MLLSGGPQKSESHPLANYHYTGKLEVELVPSAGMLIDTAVAFLYSDLRNLLKKKKCKKQFVFFGVGKVVAKRFSFKLCTVLFYMGNALFLCFSPLL